MYMGDLYGETGNIYKQIPSYLETIKLADSIHDAILEGDGCMQLGGAYLNLNKLDSALLLEQKALALFSNLNTYWKGVVYNHIGEIYFRKGNIDLSREAFFKAAQISDFRLKGQYSTTCLSPDHKTAYHNHSNLMQNRHSIPSRCIDIYTHRPHPLELCISVKKTQTLAKVSDFCLLFSGL